MTVDQIIALASSLAGLGASIIAWCTLGEMAAQGRQSRKPELVVTAQKPVLLVKWIDIWGTRAPASIDPVDDTDDRHGPYALTVHNVGVAPAKNITVDWSYDSSELVRLANSRTAFTGILAAIGSSGELLINDRRVIDDRVDVRFVLPFSASPVPTRIAVCHRYLSLCWLVCYRILREAASGIPTIKSVATFPPLSMTLRYQDIADFKYNKTASISLEAWVYANAIQTDNVEEHYPEVGPVFLDVKEP